MPISSRPSRLARAITLATHSPSARREYIFYGTLFLLLVVYFCMIVWSALGLTQFSFSTDNLDRALEDLRTSLTLEPQLDFVTLTDLQVNFMLYLPFGVLTALVLLRLVRPNWLRAWMIAGLLVGPLVSLAMETMQLFAWKRHPDVFDLLMNSLGYLCGYLSALLLRHATAVAWSRAWCARLLTAACGVVALCYYFAHLYVVWVPFGSDRLYRRGMIQFVRRFDLGHVRTYFEMPSTYELYSLTLKFGLFGLGVAMTVAWLRLSLWGRHPVRKLAVMVPVVVAMFALALPGNLGTFLFGANPVHTILHYLMSGLFGALAGWVLTAYPGSDLSRR